MKLFFEGIKHGTPAALGYLVVSFTFGMIAGLGGISPFYATLISLTSLTSAGQFAGINIMIADGTYLELIISMIVINSRYLLMSTALSQKLAKYMPLWKKLIIANFITDEHFSVAMVEAETIHFSYYIGIASIPYVTWSLGTYLGATMDSLLPLPLQNAASIALYCMFIALIVPAAKSDSPTRQVVGITIIVGILLYYVPLFQSISGGYKVLIAAVSGALYGAIRHPIIDDKILDDAEILSEEVAK